MIQHTEPELTGKQQWADTDLAKAIAPHRTFGTHKWDVGGVVAIAGSPLYTGAAQLCTRAAGRAGAGCGISRERGQLLLAVWVREC